MTKQAAAKQLLRTMRFGFFEPAFRHYDPTDRVTLRHLVQTDYAPHVVSAITMSRFDEPWTVKEIASRDAFYAGAGLRWTVVESVPVSDEIKLGGPKRDAHIAVFIETCRRLAAASPAKKKITVNFMLGPDWMRTNMAKPALDNQGEELAAVRLGFSHAEMAKIDLCDPDWYASSKPAAWPDYDIAEMGTLLDASREMGTENYWGNIEYFLAQVCPELQEMGLELAIHPDDPPFPIIRDVPRVLTCKDDYERILSYGEAEVLKLCACVGSYASGTAMDPVEMVRDFGRQRRISWYHLRNVKRHDDGFDEVYHHSQAGDVDFEAIAMAITDNHLESGEPAIGRSDHGPDLLGEAGVDGARPGYTWQGRYAGLAHLTGIFSMAHRAAMS